MKLDCEEVVMFGSSGPGETCTVIRLNPKTGERSMDQLVWGLLPHDITDPTSAPRPTHARAETVQEKPMFADAFRRRRALVAVDEISQKATIGDDTGCRFKISRLDGVTMALAGLWESFVWPDGRIERTFCVITTAAAGPIGQIHDRVAVVVEQMDWPLWLGEVDGNAASLVHAPGDGVLRLTPIGGKARKPSHV